MPIKVVIHLTDGLDGQYNVIKKQVEQMRKSGKKNCARFEFIYYKNVLAKPLIMVCYIYFMYT